MVKSPTLGSLVGELLQAVSTPALVHAVAQTVTAGDMGTSSLHRNASPVWRSRTIPRSRDFPPQFVQRADRGSGHDAHTVRRHPARIR